MYSPKIDEYLIPPLYRIAKKTNIPMTHLVNALICKGVDELEELTLEEQEMVRKAYGF